jgi:stage II sporulation protein R
LKYKKAILILSILIIFFIYILQPYLEDGDASIDGFKRDVIRFHIRANSDSKEDQDLKYRIRDEILDKMGESFASIASIEEARIVIGEKISDLEALCKDLIHEEGKDYQVKVSLGQDRFPTRKYGDMVLSQGEYESLLIEIGEAKGQNWWCVMFPPLCFVDITHSFALSAEDEVGDDVNDFIIDEARPLRLKSLFVDLLKKIF